MEADTFYKFDYGNLFLSDTKLVLENEVTRPVEPKCDDMFSRFTGRIEEELFWDREDAVYREKEFDDVSPFGEEPSSTKIEEKVPKLHESHNITSSAWAMNDVSIHKMDQIQIEEATRMNKHRMSLRIKENAVEEHPPVDFGGRARFSKVHDRGTLELYSICIIAKTYFLQSVIFSLSEGPLKALVLV